MGLDIRVPLGMIFLIIGGIMGVFGLVTHGDAALYAPSLGVDLNLTWGGVMFVFGMVMFYVGRRKKWQDDPVTPRPWERVGKGKARH
jgi:membrane protein implicated in regulation of membrane protease activity